jgi:hypothetical protein
MIACVPPCRVSEVWKAVRGAIAHALDRGNVGTEIGQVEADLFRELAQLWVAPGGVAVTQITGPPVESRHRSSLTCTLIAFAGDYAKCVEYLPILEQFGRNEGCSRFVILGRKGWKRRLADYREPYVILEKEL